MDAQKIQKFYMRAMYTEISMDGHLEPEEQFVLRTMQVDRLDIERAARLRNLRTALHDDMKLLSKLLSKIELLNYVQAYAASPYFWQHRGRTFIEDFCLFFVECGGASAVLKLVAQVEGVYSALSTLSTCHSPWKGHAIIQDGTDFLESFPAPFSLAWTELWNRKDSYQPVPQVVNCQIRRTGQKIHIKFIKGGGNDASNWLGVGLSA